MAAQPFTTVPIYCTCILLLLKQTNVFGSTTGSEMNNTSSTTNFEPGLTTTGRQTSQIATAVAFSTFVSQTPSLSSSHKANASLSVGSYSNKASTAIMSTLLSSANHTLKATKSVFTSNAVKPKSSTSAEHAADPTTSGVQFPKVSTMKRLPSDTTTFFTVTSTENHTSAATTSKIALSTTVTPKTLTSASQASDAITTVVPTSAVTTKSVASVSLTIHTTTSVVLSTEETSKSSKSTNLESDSTASYVPSKTLTSKPSKSAIEASDKNIS